MVGDFSKELIGSVGWFDKLIPQSFTHKGFSLFLVNLADDELMNNDFKEGNLFCKEVRARCIINV